MRNKPAEQLGNFTFTPLLNSLTLDDPYQDVPPTLVCNFQKSGGCFEDVQNQFLSLRMRLEQRFIANFISMRCSPIKSNLCYLLVVNNSVENHRQEVSQDKTVLIKSVLKFLLINHPLK